MAAQEALQERVRAVRRQGTPRPDVVRPGTPFMPYVWVEHDGVIPSVFHVAAWCDTLGGRSVPMPIDDADGVVEAVLTSAAATHVRSGPHGIPARLYWCIGPAEVRTYDVARQAWVGEQTWLPGPMCGRVEVG
jgi:hypothetical protein